MKSNKIGFSAMLKPSTIEQIKKRAKQDGLSQANVIQLAIDFYCGQSDTKTDSDTTSGSNSGITSETAFYQKEIDFKNKEIDRLLNTLDQQNQLLGMASKRELLLIEEKPKKKGKGAKVKDAAAIPTTTTSKPKKKGKGGKRSKKRKKK
jgi:hypothetical protein